MAGVAEAGRLKSVFSHSSSFIVPGLGSAKLTLSSRNLPRAGEGGAPPYHPGKSQKNCRGVPAPSPTFPS